MNRALALFVLLTAAPSLASAQDLGRRLERPLAERPATEPATSTPPRTTLPEPVFADAPADAGATPWVGLSIASYTLAAVALGVLIGGQVRLTDIGNHPEWFASRARFPTAENICDFETEEPTRGFCDEAAVLEPLVSASAVILGLAAVLGTVFLVLDLTTSTSVAAEPRLGGGVLHVRHRL